MIWNQVNFKAKPELYEQIQNGDIFLGGSLASETENDPIIRRVRGLRFYKTNLSNIRLHPTCVVHQCNQVECRWGWVDENNQSLGKEVKEVLGKKKQTRMTAQQVAQILGHDDIDDIMFYKQNRRLIRKARRFLNREDVPPKIKKRIAKYIRRRRSALRDRRDNG